MGTTPQGPTALLDDPERLLPNAGSSVERFRQCLSRPNDPRIAATYATPQKNTTVEVEEPKTASQPLQLQEIRAQGAIEPGTLTAFMAPRLTDWLSQVLAKRIPAGAETHLGSGNHALVEEITIESAHRAADALLDLDVFLDVISDVSRAETCSHTTHLQPVAAF